MHKVYVSKLPPCHVCGAVAHFDARTVGGPWAYLCSLHFGEFGVGLGVGRGQMLRVEADSTGCNEVGEDASLDDPPYDWYERGVLASDAAESAVERAMDW